MFDTGGGGRGDQRGAVSGSGGERVVERERWRRREVRETHCKLRTKGREREREG